MYKVKRKSFFRELVEIKAQEFRPNFINTSPIIMKILCKNDRNFLLYAWEKAITQDLIDSMSERFADRLYLESLLEEQNFYRTGLAYSEIAMKRLCEINGKFFKYAKDHSCTYEIYEIATSHQDEEKRLLEEDIFEELNRGVLWFNKDFLPDYDLEKFCEKNGRFLECVKDASLITKEILEKALSHDEDKLPRMTKLFEKKFELTDEICKLLVEKDANYLMYLPEEKITDEILDIALTNSIKPLSFDKLPTDEMEGYIHNKKKSLKIIDELIKKDSRWYTYLDVKDLDQETILNILNSSTDLPTEFLKNVCDHFNNNRDIMKKVCLLEGNFAFASYPNIELTKELIELAANNPDKTKCLSIYFFRSDAKYDCEVMKYLIERCPDWIKFTDQTTLDEDTFITALQGAAYYKYIPEPHVLLRFSNNLKIIEGFQKAINSKYYQPEDIEEMIESALSPEFVNSVLYSVLVKRQCETYNVDYRFFVDTIRKILKINEKVYTSLNYEFFQDTYHSLYMDDSYEKLLRLLNYPEIQKGIIEIGRHKTKYGTIDLELGKKKIELLSKILDRATIYCDEKYDDWVTYYNRVIAVFNKNPDMYGYFATVQDQLDDELLEILTCYTLGDHAFKLKLIDELKMIDDIREENVKKWLNSYDKQLRDEATFERAFGISANIGNSLYEQLGRCVIEGEKTFDQRIVVFFKLLDKLCNGENGCMFYNLQHRQNKDTILNPREVINLAQIIKRKIVSEYNKAIYSYKNKDESDQIDEVPIYKVAGEDGSTPFNMIIHSYAAYGTTARYSEGYSFRDEWNRPDINNHGICTSFIGNNLLATAEIKTVVYGFDDFEPSALLLSNKNDMWSQNTSFDVSTEEGYKSEYFLPKDMIRHTRYGYNEMVFERIVDGKKREPSYIVLFCDDYEKSKSAYLKYKKKGRYDTDEFFVQQPRMKETKEADIFYNSIKAAQEFGIPIVVIEKEKIAKKEQQRILSRIRDFKYDDKLNREEINEYLYDTLSSIESNAKAYAASEEKYQELFDKRLANKALNAFRKKIDMYIDSDPLISLMLIEELEDLIETMNKSVSSAKTFDMYNLKKELETKKKEVLESYNYPNHIGDLLSNKIHDEQNLLEYNQVMKDKINLEQIPISEALKLIKKEHYNKMLLTISEISDDNLYDKNDIQLNRHVENLILFSTIIASQMELSDEDLDILLTSALYQNYNNLDYLKSKYPDKDISMIEAVLYLNQKNKTKTDIEDVCNAVGIDEKDENTINRIITISKCLQDANTLENTRNIVNDKTISVDMLNFDASKRYIKFAMQLNEYYAYQDVINLTNTKPELYQVITNSLSISKSPKKILQEYQSDNNTSNKEEINYAK